MPRFLGQHFLINKNAINKIIEALDLKENEVIIEIGPGTGVLTLPLAEQCQKLECKILAIEKDRALAENLKKAKILNLEVIQGDALKEIGRLTKNFQNYKIVGNIPYYITGKLLRVLGELNSPAGGKPKLAVLTIQKEVAERMVAKPPEMNLLAAAIQVWAKPEIIGKLGPKDFSPPPKVDSAIIRLIPEERLSGEMLGKYYKFIKILFKQPRKTVLNNLSTGLKISKSETIKILQKVGLSGGERPQNLSLSQILLLFPGRE